MYEVPFLISIGEGQAGAHQAHPVTLGLVGLRIWAEGGWRSPVSSTRNGRFGEIEIGRGFALNQGRLDSWRSMWIRLFQRLDPRCRVAIFGMPDNLPRSCSTACAFRSAVFSCGSSRGCHLTSRWRCKIADCAFQMQVHNLTASRSSKAAS